MNGWDEMQYADIFDIEQLKVPIENTPEADRVAMNAHYAHMYHLKRYAGLDQNLILTCEIEHGFFTHNGGHWFEQTYNYTCMLTWSDYRKRLLELRYGAKAVPIGPYIHYVDGIYDGEKITEIKKKYGRTLLVMPSHSVFEQKSQYDNDDLEREIRRVSEDFDTVIISLPYFDLQHGIHLRFQKMGYYVVSAGYQNDCFFLKRLRTILELSDAVMANAFTTGLIYAAYLGRPVYLYHQTIRWEMQVRVMYRPREREYLLESLKPLISESNLQNQERLWKWGETYAGFLQTKTREEMKEILLSNSKGVLY